MTAFHVECPSKQISVSGFVSFRCIFTGMSVDITVSGEMKLHLESYDESYEIGFPTVHARSIISKPCIQLGGKVNIQSSKNDCSAVINYPKVDFYLFVSTVYKVKIMFLVFLWRKTKPSAGRGEGFAAGCDLQSCWRLDQQLQISECSRRKG